jgi:uncharacterized iron-regulated membrane protein
MHSVRHIKRWFWIHRWSSLICTLFLLELCVTGLPLVFESEITGWLSPHAYAQVPPGTPVANLDTLVDKASALYPDQFPTFVFVDDEEPQVVVSLATSWKEAMKESSDSTSWVRFDAHTGQLMDRSRAPGESFDNAFIDLMLTLHRSMFLGLGGELFLGLMTLLFIAALVSGVVLYGPFMKKLDFGTLRRDRSRRMKWLDLHNLVGIVSLAWLGVVGVTGFINELSTPLFGIWQLTDVKQILAPYAGKPVPPRGEWSSVNAAYDSVEKALPDMVATSIVFPGSPFASPLHYLVWTNGRTHLTSRLFDPVLVDVTTGRVTSVVEMPWYLRVLEVCRPLHFGDYGGVPLKILWAIFDVAAIIVLITGLILWFTRRKSRDEWIQKIVDRNNPEPEKALEDA